MKLSNSLSDLISPASLHVRERDFRRSEGKLPAMIKAPGAGPKGQADSLKTAPLSAEEVALVKRAMRRAIHQDKLFAYSEELIDRALTDGDYIAIHEEGKLAGFALTYEHPIPGVSARIFFIGGAIYRRDGVLPEIYQALIESSFHRGGEVVMGGQSAYSDGEFDAFAATHSLSVQSIPVSTLSPSVFQELFGDWLEYRNGEFVDQDGVAWPFSVFAAVADGSKDLVTLGVTREN